MTKPLETFKRVPAIVVFDLDYTLWPFLMDAQANLAMYKTSDNKVIDYRGHVIKHYPATPAVFNFLSRNNILICVASRNLVEERAKKLVELFGWNRYLFETHIYPGRKYNHIMKISKSCNIGLEEILFFDDERRNIIDVERLGVVSILVKNGMTMQVLMDGLIKFSDTRTSDCYKLPRHNHHCNCNA